MQLTVTLLLSLFTSTVLARPIPQVSSSLFSTHQSYQADLPPTQAVVTQSPSIPDGYNLDANGDCYEEQTDFKPDVNSMRLQYNQLCIGSLGPLSGGSGQAPQAECDRLARLIREAEQEESGQAVPEVTTGGYQRPCAQGERYY
jgi:hypothetical protein